MPGRFGASKRRCRRSVSLRYAVSSLIATANRLLTPALLSGTSSTSQWLIFPSHADGRKRFQTKNVICSSTNAPSPGCEAARRAVGPLQLTNVQSAQYPRRQKQVAPRLLPKRTTITTLDLVRIDRARLSETAADESTIVRRVYSFDSPASEPRGARYMLSRLALRRATAPSHPV